VTHACALRADGTWVARFGDVPSLLEQLGGRDAVQVVAAGLTERLVRDPALGGYFVGVERAPLERALAYYLSELLADRLDPGRRDLRAIHAGLELGDADYDRFLDCLGATLQAAGVSRRLAARVRERLEDLRPSLVTRLRS